MKKIKLSPNLLHYFCIMMATYYMWNANVDYSTWWLVMASLCREN